MEESLLGGFAQRAVGVLKQPLTDATIVKIMTALQIKNVLALLVL